MRKKRVPPNFVLWIIHSLGCRMNEVKADACQRNGSLWGPASQVTKRHSSRRAAASRDRNASTKAQSAILDRRVPVPTRLVAIQQMLWPRT